MANQPPEDHKELMPFIIFRNQLDFMSRIVEASCRVSKTMLEASRKSAADMANALPAPAETATVRNMTDMIPSTEDMQAAAAAVATAMNEAAVRAIAQVSGQKTEGDDNLALPAQPKGKFKPSISATKKPPTA